MLASLCAGAQTFRNSITAPCLGQGAYSSRFTDVFSPLTNQAALANLPATSAGVYAERRFMQQELTSYTAMAGLKLKTGGIGFSAQYFGSPSYNESDLGLGYGLRLGQVDIGARFSYTMMRAAGYGSDGVMAIEAGAIWHITANVHTGVQVYHPASSRFGKEGQEQLPRLYKMGLGYEVSENLLLTAELVKEEDKPVSLQAGIQYVLEKRFFLRGGITTGTTMPWLGAGWGWKNIRADVLASYHPQLGITPGLMLIFSGKKQVSQ